MSKYGQGSLRTSNITIASPEGEKVTGLIPGATSITNMNHGERNNIQMENNQNPYGNNYGFKNQGSLATIPVVKTKYSSKLEGYEN